VHDTAVDSNLIYDIGLHRGEDTDYYLAKGFRVVAFEANPELVASCAERFAGQLASGQLVIVEGAIVEKAAAGDRTTITFFRNDEKSIWGTINEDWVRRNEAKGTTSTEITVPIVDLAATILQHGMPYYMKIDIEGSDMACLEVLNEFRNRPHYLSMESSKTSMEAIRGEIRTLQDLGYDAFQAVEQSSIPRRQRPPIPSREGKSVEHKFPAGCSGLFGRDLPDRWVGAARILRRYGFIRLGYQLLGDSGLIPRNLFPGAIFLRAAVRYSLMPFTRAPVPGWYDTHARHSASSS
jgi:FkbM family methyltransferase